MKSSKLRGILSLAFGVISIIWLAYVDYQMATKYNQADGKTRALFGLMDVLQFSYRYFILIPAVFSILLTFSLYQTKELRPWSMVGFILSLFSIIGLATASWRLWID